MRVKGHKRVLEATMRRAFHIGRLFNAQVCKTCNWSNFASVTDLQINRIQVPASVWLVNHAATRN